MAPTPQERLDRGARRQLEEILEHRPEDLAEYLPTVRIEDLAVWMADLDEVGTLRCFETLELERQAELLQEVDDHLQEVLTRSMEAEQLIDIVEELPPDEAADILGLTEDEVGEEVLRKVEPELAEDLRQLASYPNDSAGGIMTTEFVTIPIDVRVGDAIKLLKSEDATASDELTGVFITDEQDRPVGFVSDHDLLTHGIHTPVAEIMERDIISVDVLSDQEDAANLIQKYGIENLPVVDSEGRIHGIVTADDAHEVLQVEASEDMLRLAGSSQTLLTRLPVLARVRHRVPLQIVTVAGGLLTAYILGQAFPSGGGEASTGALLRYLPITIGLAGNVGIQCSTILVRAFATGEVEPEREWSVLGSEVVVGLLMGVLCGLLTGLVAAGIETSTYFGLALFAAILLSVTWAALLGCLVPMGCRRMKIDPAVAAGPFLITLSDISGATVFVVVAQAILRLGA